MISGNPMKKRGRGLLTAVVCSNLSLQRFDSDDKDELIDLALRQNKVGGLEKQ